MSWENMSKIIITVTDSDNELFNYLNKYKDESTMKDRLKDAINIYNYCCGDCGELPGFPTPEKLKETKLNKMSKENLIKLRNEYLANLLLYAQDFHPDEIDCGILRGPDDEYWFVDDCGKLGFIALYASYIKEIDSLL